jgi:hypothetical protein
MSKGKKIERLLRRVPELAVPEDLGARLRARVVIPPDACLQSGAVRRSWFAPHGGAVSSWRVACVAGLAAVCLVSIGFGTAVVLRRFVLREYKHVYNRETSVPAPGSVATKKVSTTIYGSRFSLTGDGIRSDEDARQAEKEMIAWIKEGKAEEVGPGKYQAVLPRWGAVVYETGGLPRSIVVAENRDEKIKEMYDEIERLRQAGQFVSTLDKVKENPDGSRTYYYYVRYTLSSGETITMYYGRTSPE